MISLGCNVKEKCIPLHNLYKCMQMKCLKEPEWNSLEIPPAFHCCPRISCYHHKEQQLPAGTAGLEGLRLGRGERQRHPGSPCSSGEQRLPQAGCSINLPHRGGFAAVCLVLGIQISSKLFNPFGRKREKKNLHKKKPDADPAMG